MNWTILWTIRNLFLIGFEDCFWGFFCKYTKPFPMFLRDSFFHFSGLASSQSHFSCETFFALTAFSELSLCQFDLITRCQYRRRPKQSKGWMIQKKYEDKVGTYLLEVPDIWDKNRNMFTQSDSYLELFWASSFSY